ncbi:MAG: HPr family phosphocarrier protein [Lachnospiraceae bacterium]|jgi:catabolite repression HPr-like protein|nr:HPr family phosphocarrier protein [Lachnospiraceae bacterium]
MIKKTVKVEIPTGLEARSVAVAVQIASKYESDIYFEVETKKVNAKSIMGMMTLGINKGEDVTVCVSGADEEAAMSEMENYLKG